MKCDGLLGVSVNISDDVNPIIGSAFLHGSISFPPISRPSRKLAGVLPIIKWSSVKGRTSFNESLNIDKKNYYILH